MVLILLGWIVMIGTAYFADDAPTFWVAANLAGLCMGSSQAAGRAVVGFLSPRAREAEFFGLWGFAVKAASIVGPLTYGGVVLFFAGNYRIGILTAAAYFVIGLALLAGIDVERGRKAALLG
jgi:UMF1 family MFS transporter